MTSDNQRPYSSKSSLATGHSVRPANSVEFKTAKTQDLVDDNQGPETHTSIPIDDYAAFNDEDFITLSDSLPEMDIIFENEYVV